MACDVQGSAAAFDRKPRATGIFDFETSGSLVHVSVPYEQAIAGDVPTPKKTSGSKRGKLEKPTPIRQSFVRSQTTG
jgi:hypothetical protein